MSKWSWNWEILPTDRGIRPAHSYAVQGVFDVEQWYLQRNLMSGFKPKGTYTPCLSQKFLH